MRYGRLILAISLLPCLALTPRFAGAQGTGSTASVSGVQYHVTFNSGTAQNRHIHVSMSFQPTGDGAVLLSLPAWTPGSYSLDNFVRYVRNFEARSGESSLHWDKVDWDTWRVDPDGARAVEVSFDYRADTLDVGMAWSAPDFAFFNGTNLFFYPENQDLTVPARVTFHTEPGWRVTTGLTATANPREFTAADYHELVDMPTMIGRFDLDSMQIDGRWYRLATYPAGVLAGETRTRLWEQTQRMMPPMSAVFGETPWDTYTTMAIFDDDYPGGSALEHRNSHLGVYITQAIEAPFLPSVLAHEIFHAWNVKRLRPADMVPYDYGRAQPTTLLWVSEGITDYYADLAMVRGGNWRADDFYQATEGKIGTVAASRPVALEDASLSTWAAPADGTGYLYYPKGSLAGLMLDILIRDASDNAHSLDDVMRELYRSTYKAGTGFTEEQWWAAVRRAAGGGSFEEFHARFIDGRDPYPWDEILPLAGLEYAVDSVLAPRIGVSLATDSGGVLVTQVVPGSSAAEAGVAAGDYLVRVGEVEIDLGDWADRFRARYAETPEGASYDIVVRRGEETLTLPAHMRFAARVSRELREDPNASPKAVRVRNGLLHGR